MTLTAKQYRDAAELLEKVSRTTEDRETRAALLDLIAQFWKLAEHMEVKPAEAPKNTVGPER
jgi:hypothetical protein